MNQQKQIKLFLVDLLGEENGIQLYCSQRLILGSIIKKTSGKTASQMRTLKKTILPRIALYMAFLENDPGSAYGFMRRYMLDVVATKKHTFTSHLEILPNFFFVYRKFFLLIMRMTDLQKRTLAQGKGYFDITIQRCLWHDACVENGCTELCRLFCDVDDVTYGGLRKIGFTRTQTLGYGGACCDFHFFKK